MDGALKETERRSIIVRVIDSVKERLKDTAISKLDLASSMTRRELDVSYGNMLKATTAHHRNTSKELMSDSQRFYKRDSSIDHDIQIGNSSRFLQEEYMKIVHEQILSSIDHTREISVHKPDQGERNLQVKGQLAQFNQALRNIDFETQMKYVQQWGQRKDFENGLVMRPPVLAKLKTRQFPSVVHQSLRMERDTNKELLLAETQLYRRSAEHDIIYLNEIINLDRSRLTASTLINKEGLWGSMAKGVQTYMDRSSANRYHPAFALRDIRSGPWVIQNAFPKAQRIIGHNPATIDQEFPWGKRIIDHNPAYIENVNTQIKAHRLIVVLGAVEDTNKQILASRDATEFGYVLQK
ncbi:hypothetical protein Q0F98_02140 [Paenibacillus amylolyticus]|nr:hypothetical protein Q0F98_02140 [Paenibacillus amylolyticus]